MLRTVLPRQAEPRTDLRTRERRAVHAGAHGDDPPVDRGKRRQASLEVLQDAAQLLGARPASIAASDPPPPPAGEAAAAGKPPSGAAAERAAGPARATAATGTAQEDHAVRSLDQRIRSILPSEPRARAHEPGAAGELPGTRVHDRAGRAATADTPFERCRRGCCTGADGPEDRCRPAPPEPEPRPAKPPPSRPPPPMTFDPVVA